MATSKARRERREQARLNGGGGYGWGNPGAKPSSGQTTHVNPFILPKEMGLSAISKTFPNNYYVEWNLTTWRQACEQARNMGYPISYAALTSWAYESSSFIQSLFRELEVSVSKIPILFKDDKGNTIEEVSKELTEKKWFRDLFKEVIFANFWGFSAINFDPIGEKIYKYPMQQIDPINRFLKENTFNFYDGMRIDEHPNLLFVQPSTNSESFLGWMQPITRAFIQMNLNNNNWTQAGMRLAFPLLTVGYPQNDGGIDSYGNEVNPYKTQAETIAANINPSEALVYPFVRDINGNVQKTIEIDSEGGMASGAGTAFKIFSEFNAEQKNEIREMILLSTLTSSAGKVGSQALGNVHMEKYESVIQYTVDTAIAILNDEFLKKIKVHYNNFPEGRFAIDKAKQWDLEEIKTLAPILEKSGKKFTSNFFEAIGLNPEFIEDTTTELEPESTFVEPTVKMATDRSLLGSILKKKALK